MIDLIRAATLEVLLRDDTYQRFRDSVVALRRKGGKRRDVERIVKRTTKTNTVTQPALLLLIEEVYTNDSYLE